MKPTRPLREASLPSDNAKNSPAGARLGGCWRGLHFINGRALAAGELRAELSIQTLGSLQHRCQAPYAGGRPSSSYYLAFKSDTCQSERQREGCSLPEFMNLLLLIIDFSYRSLICQK